ncbi:hypothetical protein [Kribbella sp. NPDC051770]|uniref:hypothetical protein n=1 Tax=Kribbella sp. NPDC051770 TaxID=3155413 RepID=UPI00343FDA0A
MKVRRLVGVVVVLGMLLPASAQAAGVQDVNRVLFDRPYVEVLGASPAGVLYKVSRNVDNSLVGLSTWVKPAGGPAYQVDQSFQQLSGDKIYGMTYPSGTVAYQYVGTPTTLRCDDSPQPIPGANWTRGGFLFAPWGWFSNAGYRVEAGRAGCQVNGTYPGLSDYNLAAVDNTGYVTVGSIGTEGDRQLTYRSYADPTHPRVIADAGHTRYLSGVSLSGTAVAWTHQDYADLPPTGSYVVRSTTDGSAAPVVTRLPGWVVATAIAGTATAWTTCQGTGDCVAGSIAANGARTQVDDTRTVVADGNRFVFDTRTPTPGVDAAAGVGGSAARTRLAPVDLLPPITYVVQLGAGGVAYVDTQQPANAASRRFYTRGPGTVTLSAQTKLGQEGGGTKLVSREGRRTAYVDTAGALWLVTDDGVRTKVFTPATRVAIMGGQQLRISGSRLLWWKALYTEDRCDPPGPGCYPWYGNQVPMLYDLRTGVSTQQPIAASWTQAVDLWGNYLSWAEDNNSIWRRDLASGALLQVKAAGTATVQALAVHDDWVAWATCAANTQDDCAQSVVAHRNLQTKAAAIQLTSGHTRHVALSGGHVVYDTYASDHPAPGTLKVNRLGTSATGVVGPVSWNGSFDVHDETLAWVAPDEIARIGPNSAFVAYPKYLGNGSAPPSFNPALRLWNAEFGISKALPTCSLTIKSGPTVRRTLNCATTNGSARADWDGRDSAGRLLPAGAYTWTLAGRDGDGTLRWWTGATHAITGTVRIVS